MSAIVQKVADLWEKHGSADRHGYVDLMRADGFEAACIELLELAQGMDIALAITQLKAKR